MSDTPRTDAITEQYDFPWTHDMEMIVRHAEQLERDLQGMDAENDRLLNENSAIRSTSGRLEDMLDDPEAVSQASLSLKLFFLREGSSYGIKACEEIGRVFVVALTTVKRPI